MGGKEADICNNRSKPEKATHKLHKSKACHSRLTWIWLGHEESDASQDRGQVQRGLPASARLRLENVQANSSLLVDVGVVDFGGKRHWKKEEHNCTVDKKGTLPNK